MVKPIQIGGKPAPTATPPVSIPVAETAPSAAVPAVQSAPLPATVDVGNLPATLQKPLTQDEVLRYGAAGQTNIATATDKIAKMSRASDIDGLGDVMGKLILTAKGFDPDQPFKGGFLGYFKTKAQQLRNRYDSVSSQIDQITKLANQQLSTFVQQVKDCAAMFDQFEAQYIKFGEERQELLARIAWMEANTPVVDPNDPFSATKVSDWNAVLNMARQRADNLERLRLSAAQRAAMVKVMAQNAVLMQVKFREGIELTIPELKTTYAMAVLNDQAVKGAAVSKAIDDATNDAARKNAQMLGIATNAVHTAASRSVYDLDTLRSVNQSIIQTADDIKRIADETKARLVAEAPQIEQLSRDLAATINRP